MPEKVEVFMPNKLARLSKSRDKAVQWLNGAPKSSTPLEVAVDATKSAAWLVENLFSDISLGDYFESLLILLAAMHTSAGVEYPDSIAHLEAPTEEDVEHAYRILSSANDDCGAFDDMWQSMQRAMDVVEQGHLLYHPDKYMNWDTDDEDA
jgi:hypothetical protein